MLYPARKDRRRGDPLTASMLAAMFTTATIVPGFSQPAYGVVYQFMIDTPSSTADLAANLAAPMSGSIIGNWDGELNPGGTMTRPGLFGGSGNMPISYTGNLTGDGQTTTTPAGGLQIDVDFHLPGVSVANLAIDALAGATPTFPATFNVLYSTFRTFQPDSVYPGGIVVPIPLGDLTMTALTVTQTSESAFGSLTPTAPGEYEFASVVDVVIAFEGDLGGTIVSGELAAAMVVNGTLSVSGSDATATVSFNWNDAQTNPGPFDPIVDMPLDAPTVLPEGEIAHFLVSGQVQSVSVTMSLGANLQALGGIIKVGDVTGDHVVGVPDLLAVINAWGACAGPPSSCHADVAPVPSGDGVVGVADLLLIINNWGG